jgi:hypothetical protein
VTNGKEGTCEMEGSKEMRGNDLLPVYVSPDQPKQNKINYSKKNTKIKLDFRDTFIRAIKTVSNIADPQLHKSTRNYRYFLRKLLKLAEYVPVHSFKNLT